MKRTLTLVLAGLVAFAVFAGLVHLVLVATHRADPAATTVYGVTYQRVWASIAAGVALASCVTGGVTLTRRAPRLAIAAMIAGLIGAINGGLVLAVANGGPGSGNGVIGGAAAFVLGIAAVALGGFAVSRARTVGSAASA
jgi:FtsH-binding integral membrane protein